MVFQREIGLFMQVPWERARESLIASGDADVAILGRKADKLEAAGFWLDFGEDDSGLFLKYLRRGSGYYIDVGASELVASTTSAWSSATREFSTSELTEVVLKALAPELEVLAPVRDHSFERNAQIEYLQERSMPLPGPFFFLPDTSRVTPALPLAPTNCSVAY